MSSRSLCLCVCVCVCVCFCAWLRHVLELLAASNKALLCWMARMGRNRDYRLLPAWCLISVLAQARQECLGFEGELTLSRRTREGEPSANVVLEMRWIRCAALGASLLPFDMSQPT